MAPPGGIDTGRRGLERFDALHDPTHARIRLAKRARRREAAEERAVPEGTARPSRDHPRSNVHCMSWFDGLGVRLRRRWTQAHDGLPPRRAVRESPNFAHGAQLGGSDASPPHRTWPSRSPCHGSSIRDAGRSSPWPRCTDSGVMCIIARVEPGSTAVPALVHRRTAWPKEVAARGGRPGRHVCSAAGPGVRGLRADPGSLRPR
jgi:hypothetical protein